MQICLTAPTAFAFASVIGGLFVACLYVGVQGIPDRDDPRVIRERFLRVGAASLIASAIVGLANAPALQRLDGCAPAAPAAQWLGLWAPRLLPSALAVVLPLALTMLLFLGPLVQERMESQVSSDVGWVG